MNHMFRFAISSFLSRESLFSVFKTKFAAATEDISKSSFQPIPTPSVSTLYLAFLAINRLTLAFLIPLLIQQPTTTNTILNNRFSISGIINPGVTQNYSKLSRLKTWSLYSTPCKIAVPTNKNTQMLPRIFKNRVNHILSSFVKSKPAFFAK